MTHPDTALDTVLDTAPNRAPDTASPAAPLALPPRLERPIRVLFTDVDDTLTWQGQLPAVTLLALEQLREAGILVVPVTGACAGWCDCIVRTWPVAAVIGENGALWMERDDDGRIARRYRLSEAERVHHRQRLDALQSALVQRYPFAHTTQDQRYRETDIAFDIGQQQRIAPHQCQQLLEALRTEGVQAHLSSIHINAWLGDYDKASSASAWLEQRGLGVTDDAIAFIGDSANDSAMFARFRLSFGVANIEPLLPQLPVGPRYLASGKGGYGFAEVARLILARCG